LKEETGFSKALVISYCITRCQSQKTGDFCRCQQNHKSHRPVSCGTEEENAPNFLKGMLYQKRTMNLATFWKLWCQIKTLYI